MANLPFDITTNDLQPLDGSDRVGRTLDSRRMIAQWIEEVFEGAAEAAAEAEKSTATDSADA